tara:strand:- start:37363 stop:38031 length:669 start_codon:yes stop_codon:yes gene_type:complete
MDSKYNCKYGLFHDRPCIDNQPSSNNGWIYTAISKYALNVEYDKADFKDLYYSCSLNDQLYIITRLPGKILPPISRDEVIGMVSLGQPIHIKLILNKWNMYSYQMLENIPFLDTLKTIWKIRNKHRNFFWENEILEAYPIAMKLFPHDRYYIKKMKGYTPKALEFFLFYIYAFSIIINGSPGEQNLLYLQLRDLGSYLYKFIPFKKNLMEYFREEHIFNRQN